MPRRRGYQCEVCGARLRDRVSPHQCCPRSLAARDAADSRAWGEELDPIANPHPFRSPEPTLGERLAEGFRYQD